MARQKLGCKGGIGGEAKLTATGDPTPAPRAPLSLVTRIRKKQERMMLGEMEKEAFASPVWGTKVAKDR